MRLMVAVSGLCAGAIIAGVLLLPRITHWLGSGTAATSSGAMQPGNVVGGDSGAGKGLRDEAVVQLEREIRLRPPASDMSDEGRLAAAWAWVEANRPADWPYKEFEAKLLALVDGVLDGQKRSASWLMNMAVIDEDMLKACDADRDGEVTMDEATAFCSTFVIFDPEEHPYIRSLLDRDGDGALSEEELERIDEMDGALAGVIERARVDQWDTDGDGLLSESERESGEQEELLRVRFAADGSLSQTPEPARAEEQAEVMARIAETFGAEDLEALKEQQRFLANRELAEALMEQMRLSDWRHESWEDDSPAEVSDVPDRSAFDVDGDGVLRDEERAALEQAMQEYLQKQIAWESQQPARHFLAGFRHTLATSDADGDGRMSPEEWDARLESLIAARDKRLFLSSYDLDKSGRVDQGEVTRFIQWHRVGSLRADVNYDGIVDVRDLERMMAEYQNQGGF